jgi:cell division protein FtsI (penicillin-binding protein 3)
MVVAGMLGLAFAGVIGRAAWIALTPPQASVPVVSARQEAPVRADIVDRHGELLAGTRVVYTLFADPHALWDADDFARRLAQVFPDTDIEATAARLSDRKRRYVPLKRGLDAAERERVFAAGLEGIGFEAVRARAYPRATLAGHVLGFANMEGRGLAGLEFALDERLREGGEPVRLTLDSAVQFAVEAELDAAAREHAVKGAAAIVLEAATGEVLALASWPPIDPNLYTRLPKDDPARINRATHAVYELGSVFKPFTVVAAFEAGALYPSDTFDTREPLLVQGRDVYEHGGGAAGVSVTDILAYSSNRGTVRIGLRLGGRRLQDFLSQAGLLDRPDFALSGLERPILPPGTEWDELTVSRVSFGHGLSVSPFSFAVAFSAFANAGEVVAPVLVLPEAADASPAPQRRRVMSAPIAAAVTQMLRETVVRGTGRAADIAGYRVAGKTGTAEKIVDGRYVTDLNVTSFAALFPADDPKFVVMVVLDEPEPVPGGGETAAVNAAPAAGRIIARIAPVLGVVPRFTEGRVEHVGDAPVTNERETSL